MDMTTGRKSVLVNRRTVVLGLDHAGGVVVT